VTALCSLCSLLRDRGRGCRLFGDGVRRREAHDRYRLDRLDRRDNSVLLIESGAYRHLDRIHLLCDVVGDLARLHRLRLDLAGDDRKATTGLTGLRASIVPLSARRLVCFEIDERAPTKLSARFRTSRNRSIAVDNSIGLPREQDHQSLKSRC
jgi:hypothetical protein